MLIKSQVDHSPVALIYCLILFLNIPLVVLNILYSILQIDWL